MGSRWRENEGRVKREKGGAIVMEMERGGKRKREGERSRETKRERDR